MTTFLDSNIVIALINDKEPNHVWSVNELIVRKTQGPAVISDVVYSEITVTMKDVVEVNSVIEALGLERYPTKDAALFRAGRAFKEYRGRTKGQQKSGVLPDFFIGAIAEVENAPLMTDNSRDFVSYFPAVALITPPKVTTPPAVLPIDAPVSK
ncbi:PIN domain-containing protein [Mesorhizobium sp. M0293]|uniref:type II toxin-antitoxin system VapC family toxin n=1 Tax=unclassified Mesorhizobium TaxID=325217 RepID=UPI003335D35F